MSEEHKTPPSEQKPADLGAFGLLALAQPISQKVQIKKIDLWETSVCRAHCEPNKELAVQHNQHFGVEYHRTSDSHLGVRVLFLWCGARESGEVKSVSGDSATADIEAKFDVIYEVPGLTTFPDEQVLAFAKMNGVFNAWPYWREYLQSTSARMGMQPVTVPVLTVMALISAYAAHDAAVAATATSGPVPSIAPTMGADNGDEH